MLKNENNVCRERLVTEPVSGPRVFRESCKQNEKEINQHWLHILLYIDSQIIYKEYIEL